MFSIDKETTKSFIHSLIDIHDQILIFFSIYIDKS